MIITERIKKRFLSKVEKNEGCWKWKGKIDVKSGYGKFSVKLFGLTSHRMSFIIHKGDIPEGHHVDHLCRNRACVNPDHLEAVTIAENVMRGEGIAPTNKAKTHCSKGHEYTIENTFIRRCGRRRCKSCEYKKSREWNKLNRLKKQNTA